MTSTIPQALITIDILTEQYEQIFTQTRIKEPLEILTDQELPAGIALY